MKTERALAAKGALFVPITYVIEYRWEGQTTRTVKGFAFEIPDWPEFHACVRWDRRNPWDTFDDWIVDHFESGLAISDAGKLTAKEDAPYVVRNVLEKYGRRKVWRKLRERGVSL